MADFLFTDIVANSSLSSSVVNGILAEWESWVDGTTNNADITLRNGNLRSGKTATDTLKIQAYDVDGTSYTDFITLTAGNTPTCVLSGDITTTTQSQGDNSTKIATTAYVDSAVLAEDLWTRTSTTITMKNAGDTLKMNTTEKIEFRDAQIYLNSSADGILDIVSDTSVDITTTTINVSGTIDFGTNTITDGTLVGNWALSSGNLSGVGTIGSGAITSTGAVQGTSITDGTATLTSGAFTGLTNVTMSGTLDLGTNTIADGTLVGNWGFSSGALSAISTIATTGDITVTDAVNDGNPKLSLQSSGTEGAKFQVVYDSGAQTLDYVQFESYTASATADKGEFRFIVDGTEISQINDSGINVVSGLAYYINDTSVLNATTLGSGVTASSLTSVGTLISLALSGDITITDAVNDGNPRLEIQASGTEGFKIQAVYDSGAQTLDYVQLESYAASATADKGEFRFIVDGTEIGQVNDSGLNVVSGLAYYINDTSVLNATTLGSGVTASSLTSVGNLTDLKVGASSLDSGTLAQFETGAGNSEVRIKTTAGSAYPTLVLHAANKEWWVSALDDGADANFEIGTGSTPGTGGKLTIKGSNGYVGLGTTSPDAPFHLDHNVTGISDAHIRLTDNGGSGESSIYNLSGSLILATHGTDNASDSQIEISTTELILTSNGNQAVKCASTGDVVVGAGGGEILTIDTYSDTLANTADTQVHSGNQMGLAIISTTSQEVVGLFSLNWNSTTLIFDGGSLWSTTKGTASKYNFYFETDGFSLQNNTGSSRPLVVQILGTQ